MRYLIALFFVLLNTNAVFSQTDLSISIGTAPDTVCEGDWFYFTFKLKNNGNDPIETIPLLIRLQGDSGLVEEKKDTLKWGLLYGGLSWNYYWYFKQTNPGTYKVQVSHAVPDDSVPSNDSVSFPVYVKSYITQAKAVSRMVNVCKGDSAHPEIITDYNNVEWYDLRYPLTRPPVCKTKRYDFKPTGRVDKVHVLQFLVIVYDTAYGKKCNWQDTVRVYVHPLPVIDLGPDRFLCNEDSTVLDAGCPSCTHLWSTGDTTQKIMVAGPGKYRAWVTNNMGCWYTDSVFVDKPNPDISEYKSACQGQPVIFDAGYSATAYSWNFGDSTNSTLDKPSHTYVDTGTHMVKLTVLKGSCSTIVTQILRVYPKMKADFNTVGQCVMDSVVFKPILNPPVATIYRWNFDDGHSDTTAQPAHVFYGSGIYNVMLLVSNGGGCESVITKTITIHNPPDADFTIQDSVLTAGIGNSYEWYLNDMKIDSARNPNYIVGIPGVYKVSYENDYGCRDTSPGRYVDTVASVKPENVKPISIYPNPGKGMFTIQWPESGLVKVLVTDALGRIVIAEDLYQDADILTLDLTNQPVGYYLIRLEQNGKVAQAKIGKL